MKKRKNRWTGVSSEARRTYILARHRLVFSAWCEVVQARINLAKTRRSGKAISVPRKLKNLPILPETQAITESRASIWVRLRNWLRELFTPARVLTGENNG